MAFKIAPFPGQTYGRPYASHEDIRAYLGWGKLVDRPHWASGGTYTTLKSSKLPMGYQGWTLVPLTDGRKTALYVVPSTPAPAGPRRWRNKSSAHRTFALCPDCLKAVPAGRTHQHKCKGGAA